MWPRDSRPCPLLERPVDSDTNLQLLYQLTVTRNQLGDHVAVDQHDRPKGFQLEDTHSMNRILAVSLLLIVTLSISCGGISDASTLTGYVTDAKCAKAGKAGDDPAGCAAKCIEGGEAAVLVDADGNIHPIANQDKIAGYEGKKVDVTGSETDGGITIESVQEAS